MELSLSYADLKIDDHTLSDKLEHVLQVAAMRGFEEMVERLPARGQTKYSTGRLRQSVRFEKTGPLEYTYFLQVPYSIYVEFGTGPKGKASGAVRNFPGDPQPYMSYHQGEVFVTRWRGRFLTVPIIRHTQGMEAQPFVRPALVMAYDLLKRLLTNLSPAS